MILVDLALVLVAIGLLAAIYRGLRGPTAADRVVAAELGFIATVCALLLLSIRLEFDAVLDIALVAVLIGFLGTLGLVRLVGPSRANTGESEAGRAGTGGEDSG